MFPFILLLSQATSSPSPHFCPDGKLLPDPTDCSKFYKCAAGSPQSQSCPQPLLYNPVLKTCDWAQAVECVKVAVEESDSSSTTRQFEAQVSSKNPILAGLALTGAPVGSSLISVGGRRISGQAPAGSVMVLKSVAKAGASGGHLGKNRLGVKFVPRDEAKYEAELGIFQN